MGPEDEYEVCDVASYLTMLSPLKNLAMSWSEDCQGRPRARTTVLLSTTSVLLLHTNKTGQRVSRAQVARFLSHAGSTSPEPTAVNMSPRLGYLNTRDNLYESEFTRTEIDEHDTRSSISVLRRSEPTRRRARFLIVVEEA